MLETLTKLLPSHSNGSGNMWLTKGKRLCAKEIIRNRAILTKWQDDFHAYMVEKYPNLEQGESVNKASWKHIPTRLFKQAQPLQTGQGD